MFQNSIDIVQSLLQYSIHFFAITIVQFASFFLFTWYKTGQKIQIFFSNFVQLFIKAFICTVGLILLLVGLTSDLTLCSFTVFLLAISSVLILLEYFDVIKNEYKTSIVSLIIMLNLYVIYLVFNHEPLTAKHYAVLYAVVLYGVMTQFLNNVYKQY